MTDDIKAQAAKLAEDFKKRGENANTAIKKAILKACLTIERDIKLRMTNTERSTETVYIRGRNSGSPTLHWPSAPGSAPAVDSGRNRAAVTHRIENEGLFTPVGYVGTNVEYEGGFGPGHKGLEFGTSKMKPRPVFVPALNAYKAKFDSEIKAALQIIEEAPNG